MATKMSQGASEATDIAGKVSALLASAKQAVGGGNIPATIYSFKQLRATAPNNVDILSNLGKLYYMSSNLKAAIKFFGDSAVAAPENVAFKDNQPPLGCPPVKMWRKAIFPRHLLSCGLLSLMIPGTPAAGSISPTRSNFPVFRPN